MRLDDLSYVVPANDVILKASARLPTAFGEFHMHVFEALQTGIEHIALTVGTIHGQTDVLTRVHSECLTGDVFSSQRCDCGEQLQLAQSMIQAEHRGLIVYVRGHEGRGIGITNKTRAYALQDKGLDTVEANLALNLPIDTRRYEMAAAIIQQLGVRSIRLLTNNPDKAKALIDADVPMSRILPLQTPIYPENQTYLATKKFKLGHALTI